MKEFSLSPEIFFPKKSISSQGIKETRGRKDGKRKGEDGSRAKGIAIEVNNESFLSVYTHNRILFCLLSHLISA